MKFNESNTVEAHLRDLLAGAASARPAQLSRFDGWQATHAGEREVKKALRQTLFRYKLHQDAELFEKAYGYIREYY